MVGHVACTGEMRNAYKILIAKAKCKRPLRIHRRRWEGIIKMDRTEAKCEVVDWIYLAPE